ncbi:MAG TPA: hypothetical protein VJS11_09080 [Acidobacteriaceae bacterium]|nr:hypothetical protein [Acidobacteriaceae bacterium]
MKMRLAYPLLALGVMLMGAPTVLGQAQDSANITALLQHAREHAAHANINAERIESYTRSKTTWESHAAQLAIMRDSVNELGKDVAALTAARSEGSAWQQEAIDDVNPLLRSMADHLSAMINHLSDNQNQVHMPPYKDYARANYGFSQKLVAMINDYIDYAEAKSKTEALEQKLLLPPETVTGEQ